MELDNKDKEITELKEELRQYKMLEGERLLAERDKKIEKLEKQQGDYLQMCYTICSFRKDSDILQVVKDKLKFF